MKKRPFSLTLFGWIMIGIALSFPIQTMILFEHPFAELDLAFSKLTWLNQLIMVVLISNAMLAFSAHPRLNVFAALAVILVTLNNLWVGYAQVNFTPLSAALAAVGFFAAHSFLMLPQARRVLGDKKNRWWLTPKRLQTQLPVDIHPLEGKKIQSCIFDISESGAFILAPTTQQPWPPGTDVNLRLQLGHISMLNCTAKVVRHETGNKKYPTGLGVRFENLTFKQKQGLKAWLRNTQKQHEHAA